MSRGDNNLYLVDLATARETLLTPHEGPGSFGGGRFSRDGRTVYLGSNKDRDRVVFARVRLGKRRAGADRGPRRARDAELADFEIDDAGTTAALFWNVAGRSELEILDLASAQAQAPGPHCPRRSRAA